MTKWLNNALNIIPSYTLVLNEAQYERIMKELNIKHYEAFGYKDTTNAYVRTLDNKKTGCPLCLVCLMPIALEKSVPEIVGIIVHEAVHVWQHCADYIGETKPGIELEAYTIQQITVELVREFFRAKIPKLLGRK